MIERRIIEWHALTSRVRVPWETEPMPKWLVGSIIPRLRRLLAMLPPSTEPALIRQRHHRRLTRPLQEGWTEDR